MYTSLSGHTNIVKLSRMKGLSIALILLLYLLEFSACFVSQAIRKVNVRTKPPIPNDSNLYQDIIHRRIFLFSNKNDQTAAGITVSSASAEIVASPICRLVTRADAKLPTTESLLPETLFHGTHLLDKLDAYYHAQAHDTVRRLRQDEMTSSSSSGQDSKEVVDKEQEKQVMSVLRSSLEDSGFELLSRRDLDLCEALNAGYLLRLSILPEVKNLDPGIAKEFYPERFDVNGTALVPDELLFDGRVLVYWRGYSEEVTQGRLLLPKIDYLQASVVQRSAAWVKARLDEAEDNFLSPIYRAVKATKRKIRHLFVLVLEKSKIGKLLKKFSNNFVLYDNWEEHDDTDEVDPLASHRRIKLGRYGGSKIKFVGSPNPDDALRPFSICEVAFKEPPPVPNENANYLKELDKIDSPIDTAIEENIYDEVNNYGLTCEYDEQAWSKRAETGEEAPSLQLLERVSLSNLVDFSSASGRKELVKNFLSNSELVEPTYEEVVVVWRPLPKRKPKPTFSLPKFVSEFADMFDIEGFESQKKEEEEGHPTPRVEIRNFEGVPMSNLPAVLPKTKLVFRPADAFLFDLVSFVTFFLVISSLRLDNPKLDIIAIVSVSLWLIRTVLRYSNKLARYDLLVKNFLTSKLAYRNWGSLSYISAEAGSQRAIRAALVHSWVLLTYRSLKSLVDGNPENTLMPTRTILKKACKVGVNELLKKSRPVELDAERALKDLEELKLVTFNGEYLESVEDNFDSVEVVRAAWNDLLEGNSGFGPKQQQKDDNKEISNDKDEGLPSKTNTIQYAGETLYDEATIAYQREVFKPILEKTGNDVLKGLANPFVEAEIAGIAAAEFLEGDIAEITEFLEDI